MKTANDLIQMFAERKNLEWVGTSGDAWAQRNGTQTASFWITRKQSDWVIGVFSREIKAASYIDFADGETIIGGVKMKWTLHQTSKKSNNGAGMVKLVY